VTRLTGVWRASWAVILSRFVLNQTSRNLVVGRVGVGRIEAALSDASSADHSLRAQFRGGGGEWKRGASKRRRIGM